MKYYIVFAISLLVIIFAFSFFYTSVKQYDEVDRYKIHTTKENMIYMSAFFVALPNVFLWFILAVYCFYKIIAPVLRKINL